MFSGKERRGRKPRKSRTQKGARGVAEPSEKPPNLKRNTERQGLPTPNRHPRCRRSIHMVYASKSKVPRASVQRLIAPENAKLFGLGNARADASFLVMRCFSSFVGALGRGEGHSLEVDELSFKDL
ncbi:hypothetical protein TGRH88_057080 [Toxoplasma gondii]|uniref:Uncharacterized protein n=1 Tax=Toxoplasma gondii TaxID=5811 RepID=A0A7J6JTL8_TOXGO|nr:hypothetical protein TGRH88_057080 [Toxoplasma gondii]